MHAALEKITARIIARSATTRQSIFDGVAAARDLPKGRDTLSAGNQAHAFAACPAHDKKALLGGDWPNIAIISAYNDMLSAHQPYHRYPDLIREAARQCNATAQFAGGVPAMCDGVTQGQPGMELSLFSRDVIAMSTAIALSHNSFDAALYLGICDKIVPGLLIGALHPVTCRPFSCLRARWPQACRTAKKHAFAIFMPKAKRAAKNYCKPNATAITAPAHAHFTAPPIPIKC